MTNRTGPTYRDNRDEAFAAVAPQYLAQRLGLAALPSTPALQNNDNPDGTNYAVAGYRTDNILDSIIEPDGSVVERAGVTLRERDGYLVDKPRVDPNTLFLINGGGNDLFQGRVVDAASAAVASADLVTGVAALRQAGARYIIVSDLPDVGLTLPAPRPAIVPSGAVFPLPSTSRYATSWLPRELRSFSSTYVAGGGGGRRSGALRLRSRRGTDGCLLQRQSVPDGSHLGYHQSDR